MEITGHLIWTVYKLVTDLSSLYWSHGSRKAHLSLFFSLFNFKKNLYVVWYSPFHFTLNVSGDTVSLWFSSLPACVFSHASGSEYRHYYEGMVLRSGSHLKGVKRFLDSRNPSRRKSTSVINHSSADWTSNAQGVLGTSSVSGVYDQRQRSENPAYDAGLTTTTTTTTITKTLTEIEDDELNKNNNARARHRTRLVNIWPSWTFTLAHFHTTRIIVGVSKARYFILNGWLRFGEHFRRVR